MTFVALALLAVFAVTVVTGPLGREYLAARRARLDAPTAKVEFCLPSIRDPIESLPPDAP